MGHILKSKAVWGAVAAAVAWLFQQPHIGPVEVIQAAGGIISVVGVRDAITKSAPPDSPEGAKRDGTL